MALDLDQNKLIIFPHEFLPWEIKCDYMDVHAVLFYFLDFIWCSWSPDLARPVTDTGYKLIICCMQFIALGRDYNWEFHLYLKGFLAYNNIDDNFVSF